MQTGFTKIDIGLLVFYAALSLVALIMYLSTRNLLKKSKPKNSRRQNYDLQ
ncbi:MAG: hypothetical protein G01um101416_728 [Microgenomates group bacterium Gr01-1014_16]|nr:MAG: hypothetical protein G01um101416_728 [Microgenomates group bacterium Gr01-1014_16]